MSWSAAACSSKGRSTNSGGRSRPRSGNDPAARHHHARRNFGGAEPRDGGTARSGDQTPAGREDHAADRGPEPPLLLEDRRAGLCPGARPRAVPRVDRRILAEGRGRDRAMIQRPAITMLDETSEGLSPVMVEQLVQVIKRLQAEKITLLTADQNLRFCSKIAERGYVLERGRVQFQGSIEEFWRKVEADEMSLMN